jgi:hypothetical protein
MNNEEQKLVNAMRHHRTAKCRVGATTGMGHEELKTHREEVSYPLGILQKAFEEQTTGHVVNCGLTFDPHIGYIRAASGLMTGSSYGRVPPNKTKPIGKLEFGKGVSRCFYFSTANSITVRGVFKTVTLSHSSKFWNISRDGR